MEKEEEKECTLEIVNGFIKRCCKVEYSPYFDCRSYASSFMDLCRHHKIGEYCTMVSIKCEDGRGHRINKVFINGKLCLVDPQLEIVSCDVDTPEKYNAAICKAMDLPPDCKCTSTVMSFDPLISEIEALGDDFAFCGAFHFSSNADPSPSFSTEEQSACEKCCEETRKKPSPVLDAYIKDCKKICKDMSAANACIKPGDCRRGYVSGTCDRKTCRQKWNTGNCAGEGGSAPCSVILRRCDEPIFNCDNPSR